MSSGTVDTKSVEMRFDNSDFESNVKQSMSTLEKLKKALKLDGASVGLEEVEKASRKLEKNLDKDLGKSTDGAGKKFKALEEIAIGALRKIGDSAAQTGIKVAKSLTVDKVAAGWDKYAKKTTAVQTIMSNLRDEEGQFVDEAAKMNYVSGYLNKLLWFSDETSYNFTDMTENVGKFIANGQNLKDSVTAMQGIATWAAKSGQNAQVASRAMYNISQALGVGSMKVKDWMSIENANMATAEFKQLAIQVGEDMGKIKKGQVTIENFRESLSGKKTNGWFDKKVMMKVFETYGEAAEKIQEYSEKSGRTATEIIRDIQNGNEDLAKEVGVSVDSIGFKAFAASQEAKTFREAVDATSDAVSTKWSNIFENVFGNYEQAKKLWTDFANDMYDLFAAPLEVIEKITSFWNRGFLKGKKSDNDKLFERGAFDDLNSEYEYVSQSAAEMAVANDSARYSIKTLGDGTKVLCQRLKDGSGKYKEYYKTIYNTDDRLVSGRELLIDSFRNIFNALVHDTEDAEGNVNLSLFGAIKQGFLEVVFGADGVSDAIPTTAEALFNLTERFHEFTENLKPSEETLGKVKNAFKGLFTVFKIVGKVIKAVLIKPFQKLFGENFLGDASSGILDLADSIGTWLQKLGEFLDGNVLETMSSKVGEWVDKIKTGIDKISKFLTGLSLKEFISKIKKDVLGFFGNFDFKEAFGKIGDSIKKAFGKVKQTIKNSWASVKAFILNLFKNPFGGNGSKEASVSISSRFQPIINAFKSIFVGLGNLFDSVSPYIESAGKWIGNFLSNLGKYIKAFVGNKSGLEVLKDIMNVFLTFTKGKFFLALSNIGKSISNFFGDLTGENNPIKKFVNWITGRKTIHTGTIEVLDAIKGVFKSYASDIDKSGLLKVALAIGVLAASLFAISKIEPGRLEASGKALAQVAGIAAIFYVILRIFSSIQNKLNKTKVGKDGKIDPFEAIKNILTGVVQSSIFANDFTAKFVKIALGAALLGVAFKKISEGMTKVAEAIVAFGKITPEQLKDGGLVMVEVLGVFSLFTLISGFSRKASSALFAALGAFILVGAIKKLVNFLVDLGSDAKKMAALKNVLESFKSAFDEIKAIAKWAILIAGALMVAELLVVLFTSGKSKNLFGLALVMKQFGKTFIKVALSIAIIAGAFALMGHISKTMKSSDVKKILNTLIIFVGVVGGLQILLLILSKLGKKKGFTSNTSKVLKQFGKTFIAIGLSLVFVAAAFAIMGRASKGMKEGDITKITWMLGVFIFLVGALMLVALAISKSGVKKGFSDNTINVMKQFGRNFIRIAGALLVLSLAFAVFRLINMNNTQLTQVSIIFGVFVGLSTLLTWVASKIAKNSTKSKNFASNMKSIGKMFLSVAGSMVIVSFAFGIMSILPLTEDEMWDVAGVFGAFALVVGAFTGASIIESFSTETSNNFVDNMKAIANMFLKISLSMVIVAVAFAIMSALKLDKDEMWDIAGIFGAFAGVVLVMGIAGAIIGAVGGSEALTGIAAVAGTLFAAAISMAIVALAFAVLTKNATVDQMKEAANIIYWFGIVVGLLALVGGILTAFTGGMGGLGILAIAALIVSIGAACLIAGAGIFIAVYAFSLFVDALSDLITAIADKGPEFVTNVDSVVKAGLNALIDNSDLFKQAGLTLIKSLGVGVGKAIKTVGGWIFEKLSTFWQRLIASFSRQTDENGFPVDVEPTISDDEFDTVEKELAQEIAQLRSQANTTITPEITVSTNTEEVQAEATAAGEKDAKTAKESYMSGLKGWLDKNGINFGSISSDGSASFTDLFNIGSLDMSSFSTMIKEAFGSFDFKATFGEAFSGFLSEDGKLDVAGGLGITGLNFGSLQGIIDESGASSGLSFDSLWSSLAPDFVSSDGTADAAGMAGINTVDTSSLQSMINAISDGSDPLSFKTVFQQLIPSYVSADGTVDFAAMSGISNIDASQMQEQVSSAATSIISEFTSTLTTSTGQVESASSEVASSAGKPIIKASKDAKKWGGDLCANFAKGLRNTIPFVKDAAFDLAEAIRRVLHFSEPDEGPLSDFHTYAPDMIKLWNKGIYDNLGSVEESASDFADSAYDGFSTALDYVSDLIDNGMSDQLTIRPVMDLSEIQNGINSIDGMLSAANGYQITGTARLAASAAYGMRSPGLEANTPQIVQGEAGTINNTFYITNSDPDAVAEKVSRIIRDQTNRRKVVWDRK